MINKSQFKSLENELDVYAKKRQLNSDLAKQYIDDYFELLLLFFKQINEIESIDLNHLDPVSYTHLTLPTICSV